MSAQILFSSRPNIRYVNINSRTVSATVNSLSTVTLRLYVIQCRGINPHPVPFGSLHAVINASFPAYQSFSDEWAMLQHTGIVPPFEVRFQHVSGSAPNSGDSLNTWMQVDTASRIIGVSRNSNGTTTSGILVQFRRGDTLEMLGQATITLSLTRTSSGGGGGGGGSEFSP